MVRPFWWRNLCSGPEFTVGILGNEEPCGPRGHADRDQGMPPEESIYSLEVKREWGEKVQYHCPPPVDGTLLKRIEEVALRSYRALDCRDVSRVDIRVGEDGVPYFLEVNPLPGLSPVYGDLPIMARANGMGLRPAGKDHFSSRPEAIRDGLRIDRRMR